MPALSDDAAALIDAVPAVSRHAPAVSPKVPAVACYVSGKSLDASPRTIKVPPMVDDGSALSRDAATLFAKVTALPRYAARLSPLPPSLSANVRMLLDFCADVSQQTGHANLCAGSSNVLS